MMVISSFIIKNKRRGDLVNRAIGVIDSGVGGLTVANELMRQIPKEKLIYLGDTKRCPYGSRTKKEIQQFTWEMVSFLLKKNIKMLVVACNTATAYTLKSLQETLDIPVIGVIQPGARTAIKTTKNHHIAIIGTEGTIRSGAYPNALSMIDNNIKITAFACPELVPLVEQGTNEGDLAEKVVRESLIPLSTDPQIDTLILGCTHYPLLTETIQKAIGQNVTIISSGEETAREVSTILAVHGIFNKESRRLNHSFYTTGDLEMFTNLSRAIFYQSIEQLESVQIKHAII